MNNTYYIEKAVLASVLNSEVQYDLNANKFSTMFHKKLVNGINRLKELGEYIDFEILRNKFLKANKWTFEEDNMLMELMTNTTPFSTQNIFNKYTKIIDDEYINSFDRRLAI